MTRDPTREPTCDECNRHTIVDFDGHRWMAIWYPQMGGYAGMAWAEIEAWSEDGPPCFDILVWHDGEFAFSGEGQAPSRLHHCSAEQFIRFGETVLAAQNQTKIETNP